MSGVLSKQAKVLLRSSNLWYLGEGMMGPILAVFAERIGGNVLDISWIWATYLIVEGVLTVVVGKVSDKRIRKETLMAIGYALNALFTFGYIFATTPLRLFFVQAGLGVAAALATPTWNALYARHDGPSGYMWGLADGQAKLVTGAAIVVGGMITFYFSFTMLFLCMGLIQTCAACYQAYMLYGQRVFAPMTANEPG